MSKRRNKTDSAWERHFNRRVDEYWRRFRNASFLMKEGYKKHEERKR